MSSAAPTTVPATLLLALSVPTAVHRNDKQTPSPASSLPIPSSAYLVSLSSRPNSQASYDPSPVPSLPTYPPRVETMATPSISPRPSHDVRTSDEADQANNRDSSVTYPSPGNRLNAVSENEGRDLPSYYRRESHTSTFGPRDGGGSDNASPEPNFRAPTPGSLSAPPSDALRRQSFRSSRQSKDSSNVLKEAPLPTRSEKQQLARASDDDSEHRPVSGSYRLTLKTTNESTNGYTGYGSSNGHSEYLKKAQNPRIPRSSYYVGPPAVGSAFGTEPLGEIGTHYPREIVRVERDYSGGELVQFYPTYPLEFEGRITPTKFQASINEINEILISAYSLRWSTLENMLGVATLYLSTFLLEPHYDKEMRRLARLFDKLNKELYNPAGLNLLWPRKVGFLFLEIEYY